ncbi:MAG: DNA-binding protein [Gammaproteobacteria bacterium]|nr:MAG: DNA-binding protein [Gammaproteobacteria bacterium]
MDLPSYFMHLRNLANISSVEEVHDACTYLLQELGFVNFAYVLRVPTSFSNSQIILIDNYPLEWQEHYFDQNYMGSDPTISYCSQNILPKTWGDINLLSGKSEVGQRIMNEATDVGLKLGVAMPVHTPSGQFGILNCSVDNDNAESIADVIQAIPYVQLLASHLHEAVDRVFGLSHAEAKTIELTPRERECLLWTADGKTAWETSVILNISERTVNYHLNNSAGKLNVSNRQHAVAKAVLLGVISPQPF